MSRMVVRSPTTPVVVAQRLSDLLQCFPSAAVGGVQWRILVKKYEERHGSRLDLAALGQDTPLAAATTLLWDVVRVVDSEDTDNPVVAVEDSVALSPQPGSSASWPSLYQVLAEVAQRFGTVDQQQETASGAETTHGILVSQLKPLLQSHWHGDFNESNLGYLTEEGTPIRMKKMKHLLQALLRWREQRLEWRAATGAAPTALDAALEPRLELVPSANHNDLVLRCVQPRPCPVPCKQPAGTAARADVWEAAQPGSSRSTTVEDIAFEETASIAESSSASVDIEQELAFLRAENAQLRMQNCFLQHCTQVHAPAQPQPVPQMVEVFDDPFEPPPQTWQARLSSLGCARIPSPASTMAPRDFGFGSGTLTPLSAASGSHGPSGCTTPVPFAPGSQQMCAFVPMCFTMMDQTQIPCGVVQQARAIFERGSAVLPSFFVQQ